MKTKRVLYVVLMLLPLVMTLAALPLLPEQIPAHYGPDNVVTRWGSKYETLVFPAMSILFGLLMLLIARAAGKQENGGGNNARICMTAGAWGLVLFNGMTAYFLGTDFAQLEDLSQAAVDLDSLMWSVLGVGLIVLGNIMPRTKRNSLLGLRTVWSMSSEQAWKKSQRFGGIVSMVSGAAVIAVCLAADGTLCTVACLGILLAMAAADVSYSYLAAKDR